MANLVKVTLKRSVSKCSPRQVATLVGLGLKRPRQTKVLLDTPCVRGMVCKMQHMLVVECFEGDDSLRKSARLRKGRARGK